MKSWQINRLLVFLLLNFYLSPYLLAQNRSNPKAEFSEAESYFLYEEFTEALPLFVKLKERFPDNYNLDYKIGRCYLSMPYERQKAVGYLENAVKHISLVTKETSLKETKAPLDALFYLGDAYRINNQSEKAIQTYQEFKQRATDKTYDFTLVNDEIKACERATLMKKRPVEETESNLGATINTRFSETNPVVSDDENMIVYATKLPFYQAMFYSKKVNGKWTTPLNMLPELGIDGDCFPTSISRDGTELYMYRSNEYLGDLYVSNYKSGAWSKIRKLNGNINTRYWESHACISSDGKTLYFTSNRKGGYGGLDIYKSTRLSTGADDWGVPQNLGPVINSAYNDDTPFITEDGKRLYFSSFGHETMGGYDIFYSELNPDGTWSKPINMGYPINTTDDEMFFYPVKDGSVGYMAKFDPKGYGRFDIFRYEIAVDRAIRKYLVSGNVKFPQNNGSNGIYLVLYDKVKKDTVLRLLAPMDTFSFETASGNYNLYLRCKGCQSQVIALNIPNGSKERIKFISTSMLPLENSFMAQSDSVIAALPNAVGLPEYKALKDLKAGNSDSLKKTNNTGNDFITAKNIFPQKDSLASQISSGSNSDTKSKTGVSLGSRLTQLLMSSYLMISGILLVLLVIIFIFIRRRRKKQKES